MQANHSTQRRESLSPGGSGSPEDALHGPEGEPSFPARSTIGLLLEALHQHEKAALQVRTALARYCDDTKGDGAAYLQAMDWTSKVEELLNLAIEDLEARSMSQVRR